MIFPLIVTVQASLSEALYEKMYNIINDSYNICVYMCINNPVGGTGSMIIMTDNYGMHWLADDDDYTALIGAFDDVEPMVHIISREKYNLLITLIEDKTGKTINELSNGTMNND